MCVCVCVCVSFLECVHSLLEVHGTVLVPVSQRKSPELELNSAPTNCVTLGLSFYSYTIVIMCSH